MRTAALTALLAACASTTHEAPRNAATMWVPEQGTGSSTQAPAGEAGRGAAQRDRLITLLGAAGAGSGTAPQAGAGGSQSPQAGAAAPGGATMLPGDRPTAEAPQGAPACADMMPPFRQSIARPAPPRGQWRTLGPYVCDPVPPCSGGLWSDTWCNPSVAWTNGTPSAIPLFPGDRLVVHASALPPLTIPAANVHGNNARARAPNIWKKPPVWSEPGGGPQGEPVNPVSWQGSEGMDCMIWSVTIDPTVGATRPGPVTLDFSYGGAGLPEQYAGWVEIMVGDNGGSAGLGGDLDCP